MSKYNPWARYVAVRKRRAHERALAEAVQTAREQAACDNFWAVMHQGMLSKEKALKEMNF